jgi:hypothetical protein
VSCSTHRKFAPKCPTCEKGMWTNRNTYGGIVFTLFPDLEVYFRGGRWRAMLMRTKPTIAGVGVTRAKALGVLYDTWIAAGMPASDEPVEADIQQILRVETADEATMLAVASLAAEVEKLRIKLRALELEEPDTVVEKYAECDECQDMQDQLDEANIELDRVRSMAEDASECIEKYNTEWDERYLTDALQSLSTI